MAKNDGRGVTSLKTVECMRKRLQTPLGRRTSGLQLQTDPKAHKNSGTTEQNFCTGKNSQSDSLCTGDFRVTLKAVQSLDSSHGYGT